MRVALVLAAATVLLVAVAGYGLLGGGKDSCEIFAGDLDLAVLEPTKATDPEDRDALTYGSCSSIVTRKFDAEVLGWDRHTEHTVAGRVYVDRGDRRRLDATRAAVEEGRGVRVTPPPELGPGAFLVTRTRPEVPEAPAFDALPDRAGALPLPATAYWVNDRGDSYSTSATRDGASVEQAQRATVRLAQLVNRRPAESAR